MRRRYLALAGVLLVLAIGFWITMRAWPRLQPVRIPMAGGLPPPNDSPSRNGTVDPLLVPAPSATTPARSSSVAPISSPTAAATPEASIAPPDDEAMLEIDKVSLMIRDYRSIAGENPVGTNAEIMAAIMGDNPKHAKLGPPEGMQLNEKGELLDRWGTPYFFHQISRDHMEIHSAGPDRVLWTADDPIIR